MDASTPGKQSATVGAHGQARRLVVTVARTPEDLQPPDRYKALIFDFDGTLVNTDDANFLAISAALLPAGVVIERTWFTERAGLSTEQMARLAAQEQGKLIDLPAVISTRDRVYRSHIDDVVQIEAVATVARQQHGVRPLALATNGSRDTVLETAAHLGLLPLFQVVTTRDEASRGKPFPDIYLNAAAALGLSPEECLAYEDSKQGIAAARAAGIDVIDVSRVTGLKSTGRIPSENRTATALPRVSVATRARRAQAHPGTHASRRVLGRTAAGQRGVA